jgi:uncharacterized Zn-binding protein involved in type VI secretion
MAVTYFGLCNAAGVASQSHTDNSGGAYYIWNNNANFPFTCPGTGTQNIVELSAMVHIGTGTPNIRCAVYSADYDTVIAQGTAKVAVSGSSDTWQGHMTAASVGNASLTGGTNYVLVVGSDGDMATDHCKVSDGIYFGGDKTGGYSGAISGSPGYLWPVRCGVEPAAGGGVTGPSFIDLVRSTASE